MRMSWTQGVITNPETGKTIPVKINGNVLSVPEIIVGFFLIGGGIGFLLSRAFIRGSYTHELCEYKAMYDAGLINPTRK